MSQSDGALQQIETTNNRLMNLGRQVVDMRAEIQVRIFSLTKMKI